MADCCRCYNVIRATEERSGCLNGLPYLWPLCFRHAEDWDADFHSWERDGITTGEPHQHASEPERIVDKSKVAIPRREVTRVVHEQGMPSRWAPPRPEPTEPIRRTRFSITERVRRQIAEQNLNVFHVMYAAENEATARDCDAVEGERRYFQQTGVIVNPQTQKVLIAYRRLSEEDDRRAEAETAKDWRPPKVWPPPVQQRR
jgi:hypothetical protein